MRIFKVCAIVGLAFVCSFIERVEAQTIQSLHLDAQTGLSLRGQTGSVYVVQFTTNLTQPQGWRCASLVRLPATPYTVPGVSVASTSACFYRAISNMVYIPPGTFTMGSLTNEQDRNLDEAPQTKVTFTNGFWMARHLVTELEYVSVMATNPCLYQDDLLEPVEQVTWFDATNYCAALTQQELAASRIPAGYRYRLPTEAEYEYAARAGTTNRFFYGDDPGYTNLQEFAWYLENSDAGQTYRIGQKQPNPWGLYDIYGNVAEWCQDWYGTYPGGSVTNYQGPATGSYRVLRGGSFRDYASVSRSACRSEDDPLGSYDNYGFRVVLSK